MIENTAGNFEELPKESSEKKLCKYNSSILKNSLDHFISTTSLIPKIGFELEFYLLHKDHSQLEDKNIVDEYICDLTYLTQEFDLIYGIQREQGVGQIEIKTFYTSELHQSCQELEKVKIISQELALKKNLIVTFAAQPFLDDCGSSLQFNISLHDEIGNNLFSENEIIISDVAAALLNNTNSMIFFLAPNIHDYLRFDEEINRNLHKKGKYTAPVNLSFGLDNRTCAIRIPAIESKGDSHNDYGNRIEYRIASAGANPYLATSAILRAMLSLKQKRGSNVQKIYGNAFDKQYDIDPISQEYFQEEWLDGNL